MKVDSRLHVPRHRHQCERTVTHGLSLECYEKGPFSFLILDAGQTKVVLSQDVPQKQR